MADSLLNPSSKDTTPVCYLNRSGRKTSAPKYVAEEMVRKYGGEILPYEQGDWKPKKRLKPFDEEKKAHAQKSANTKKTGVQLADYNKMSHNEINELGKKHGIELGSKDSKKIKLEKLEEAGVLY